MYVALGIFIIIFSIIIHELAHAVEMRRNGILIKEIGLGIPIPKITFSFFDKWFFSCKISISPLIIGAFVKPFSDEEEKIDRLPYNKLAVICGAGPWINLVFGSILLMAGKIIEPDYGFKLIYFVPVAALLLSKKIFSRYFSIIIGLIAMFYLSSSITDAIFGAAKMSDTVGGPVALTRMVSQESINFVSAMVIGGFISISVGVFNLLPIGPLDGGRIMSALIRKYNERASVVYNIAGYVVFGVLIILALSNDFLSFFR